MTIIDRYIAFLFLKIFLICFISFAGLYVVIDAFTNLEELLELAKAAGGLGKVMSDYYGPRLLQFFDRTAPLIALVAAIFSMTLMQRSNELTAIQAGGISYRRIAKPILLLALLVIGLTVTNRELWIPKIRTQLTLNAQDLAGARGHSFGFAIDHSNGMVIRGKQVLPTKQSILAPEFTLPESLAHIAAQIKAESGEFLAAEKNRPSGYLLKRFQITQSTRKPTKNLSEHESDSIVYLPGDHQWLEPDQAFVVTDIDAVEMAFGDQLIRYASLAEMVASSRRPSTSFSNRQRVDIHARLVQPVFDFAFLLIGLPLVVARGERNIFLAVGICLLMVVLMFLAFIGCHAMGAARIVHPPALAAWMPLMLFLPVAAVTYQMLDR